MRFAHFHWGTADGQASGSAKFTVGQVVRHRVYPFRGIIFDIDPIFNNTEEWWQSIPAELRPKKDQPFYHLLAENAQTEYIAYVSEQNLLPDASGAAAAPSAGGRAVRGRRGRQLSAAVPAAAALSAPDRHKKAPGNSGRTLAMIAELSLISLPLGRLPWRRSRRRCGSLPSRLPASSAPRPSSCWRCAICCISALRASPYCLLSTGAPA